MMGFKSFYISRLEPAFVRRPLLVRNCGPSRIRCRTANDTLAHGTIWRGAKTKSAAKLKDLVQGPLQPKESLAPLVNDAPQYPTVILGAKYNMQKFKDCVLLTRVGNFYEVSTFYLRF